MKVLYIVTAFPRSDDDLITPWLVETIHRLQAVGIDVEVLAPSYRGLDDQTVTDIRVHRFRYGPARWEDLTHDQTAPDRLRARPLYAALLPSYLTAGTAAAVRLARSGRFSLLHVHWPLPHAAFGLAARAASGLPLVLTFHGVELTWARRQLPFLHPLLRRAIRSADAVTANSSYTEAMIRALHERPVIRIPFGATIAPPRPGPSGPAHPRARAVPADAAARHATDAAGAPRRLRLLFAGRLVERKGVAVLLRALAGMAPEDRPLAHVIGDGPLRDALQTQSEALGLADSVSFHGFVPEAELAAQYEACDAFVLPAIVDAKGDTEGLGVVLIEALAHGKPAIASRAGGIVDVVRDRETGLLVPPGDVEALRTAIRTLASDSALRIELGRRGRERVERDFAWPVIIERLTGLYGALAARESA